MSQVDEKKEFLPMQAERVFHFELLHHYRGQSITEFKAKLPLF